MTPLHILACSTVHHLEIYHYIIDQYPETLIMEDARGVPPLMYTIWGSAPNEIIQLLVKSYLSHHPNHQFNWNMMVLTLGRINAQPAVIQNLLNVHQCLCPEQVIDWNSILMELAVAPALFIGTNIETLYFLTSCSIVKRVEAIGVKLWRDSVASHVRGKLLQLMEFIAN